MVALESKYLFDMSRNEEERSGRKIIRKHSTSIGLSNRKLKIPVNEGGRYNTYN